MINNLVNNKRKLVNKPAKVAIVHDWLIGGGAELVVEQLHKMYPDAPIYTSYSTDEWRKRLDDKVVTGWLQRFGKIRKFIPMLRIIWFTRLDLSGYDLVISSSGAEAKGIKVPEGTIHINYCHAPTHYYWSRYDEYMKRPGFGKLDWLARIGLKLLVGPLRSWDYKAAQRPHYIIANSSHIQAEIKNYYDRNTTMIIHPPVNTDRFKPTNKVEKQSNYVIAGRQTPYKRIDLAVIACSKLKAPLTVIGRGPDHERLKSLAGPSVTFLNNVSDTELVGHFQSAAAFIFPGIDDFGITPVEAMAAGTPVIAYEGGGALDYVVPGKTGEFFAPQTTEALMATINNFDPLAFSPEEVSAAAMQFSPNQFQAKMTTLIKDTLPN